MTREHLEKRKAEIAKQRDAMLANLQFANGALAMLEEILNAPPPPPPETPTTDD